MFTPDPAAEALIVSVAIGSKLPGSDAPGLAVDEAQAVLDGIKRVGRSPVLAELGADFFQDFVVTAGVARVL